MALRTRLTVGDIKELARRYHLEVTSWRHLRGGFANSSYLLETSRGTVVATVNETRSMEEVSRLGRLLAYLAAEGVPTTRPLATTSGQWASDLAGKPVMLKAYIPGHVPDQLTPPLLGPLGEAMARLHAIAPPDYLPIEPAVGRGHFGEIADSGISTDFEKWLEAIRQTLDHQIPGNLPRSLIHGDLFFDNTLFLDGQLQALIDFEEACLYFSVFDLGMGVVGLCADGSSICLDKTRAFIQGYLKHRTLSVQEREALKLFVVYAAAAIAFWRFKEYNLVLPGHDRAEKYREMVLLANEVAALSETTFAEHVLT